MTRSLEEIFKEDQTDRLDKNIDWNDKSSMQCISLRDSNRRHEVQKLINQGALKDSADYNHAAMIFQHGDTSDDYKIANDLAKKGLEIGESIGGLDYESCKWIYAASLDRYLLSTGQKQKYGTQFQKNDKGEWELSPWDPETTDQERDKYHVPPISKALKVYKERVQ